MKLWYLAVFSATLSAQSVLLLPSPPSHDGSGTVYMQLVARTEVEPASLQWRISVPDGIAIQTTDITAAVAVEHAGKSVTCAVPQKPGAAKTILCVLVGGTQRLPNGEIIQIHFKRTTAPAPVVLTVDQILGATPGGQLVTFSDVRATLSPPDQEMNRD